MTASAPRRAVAPLAALASAAAAFGCVAAAGAARPGAYPACPVFSLTGLHCPGCGGLRSADALTRGDLAAAVGANALAVAGFAALALALAAWLAAALRHAPAPGVPPPCGRRLGGRRLGAAAAVVTAAFTVARNVPLGAALAP